MEASGPWPGTHWLVSLGAVVVHRAPRWTVDRSRSFYAELQPLEGAADVPDAMAVHGLTRQHLEAHGKPPLEVMQAFRDYYRGVNDAVVAAWPASFDHPWVGWYCQRFLGEKVVGHSAFCMASFAMGLFGCTDRGALNDRMRVAGWRKPFNPRPHHALEDAVEQGETLAWLLNQVDDRGGT